MSKKKSPVRVTIKRTKQSDPFSVVIDKPGASRPYRLKDRYKSKRNAWVGALRSLDAITIHGAAFGHYLRVNGVVEARRLPWKSREGHVIEVTYIEPKKK